VPIGLIVLPVVIVAVVVGALLFMGGGKVVRNILHHETTPPFDFKVGKTTSVSTSDKFKAKALQSKADQAAQAALPTIDTLFTEAYLNPNNWKHDDYGSALDEFDDAAQPSAEHQLATVTLGPNAGSTYTSVAPSKSKVWFKVLFDPSGNASQVVARVRFHALGKRPNGTYTDITAHGEFFMRSGDWKIYAFTIGRSDHETTPPAGPSPGASPSASS
jgi:hypothetical protein